MRRKDFRLIDSLNERLNASLRSIESHEIFGDFIQAITFTSPSLPFSTCARVYVYEFANCAFTGCWLAKRNNKSGCLIYGASKMRNDEKKSFCFRQQIFTSIECAHWIAKNEGSFDVKVHFHLTFRSVNFSLLFAVQIVVHLRIFYRYIIFRLTAQLINWLSSTVCSLFHFSFVFLVFA